MGLFDHLFKPRPEGVERIIEAPLRASGLVEKTAPRADESAPDPDTAFLQPKGYATGTATSAAVAQSQGFLPVLPGPRKAPIDRKPAPAEDLQAGANEIVLTVGDVLPRIPVALLRPGPRDLKRVLRFHIDELSSDITRGRPGVALSLIAAQCPELFHSPIGDDDDMEIRLPLQKLVEQVGRIRAGAPAAAAHP
ncbi:MAG TPA: hypothetical protein VEO95_07415, partial [Chthoniobacteraceae bacterium]|nr:hypothetical protein [Chthoniobacteraceae bacterium]